MKETLALKHYLVKMSPEQVYFVKFILEAYDNLFLPSTLDQTAGAVIIRVVYGEDTLLEEILESISERIGLECMEEVV